MELFFAFYRSEKLHTQVPSRITEHIDGSTENYSTSSGTLRGFWHVLEFLEGIQSKNSEYCDIKVLKATVLSPQRIFPLDYFFAECAWYIYVFLQFERVKLVNYSVSTVSSESKIGGNILSRIIYTIFSGCSESNSVILSIEELVLINISESHFKGVKKIHSG